ncbi:PorT family protein [Tenacibaculum finnmarkense genomovar finnmarkense]|uniref:porin family protein n=1 Tax=Tenacibaculum finnmarkense TaxID=2781243 RepID=UPI001E520BBC|nr:porin family protein [Tenacibaculum finnmarkense]MCD8417555.1 PorT family protein [Tenacibaculum finnmarkense genomovar finnmarkense]MCD8447558.1 PorT family protein [Tenacibaculum finnmarkense genomovar finnmarkense]MCD8454616.1 PorT family protein [Tenacibaculum finnmarkense genomovar ulcerans]MCG8186007.1 PorT family protein [Tenacibaculum finnmarkense genomovar finnmarkense]MCG8202493.1 PorT family protein [Tenacibaculum finnmarkense genomovar finnmarkense]
MKKIILGALLFIGATQMQGQTQYGIKGGINYNSDSFSDVKNDVLSGGESKTGFHAGVFLRGKIPIIGLFIQPELVYTQLNSDVIFTPDATSSSIKTSYSFRKIDVPVLIGKKLGGVGRVFAGPTFQYVIEGDFDTDKIKDVKADGFSVGMQLGAGLDLGKFGVDVRWERAFSDTQSELIKNKTAANPNTTNVEFDTRVNQIIVGISYMF